MNWLKLLGPLVTFAFVATTAEGTRKKIRIHIPQKVKHIYHHKKIYITNHPASTQYAPAYLPTAESSLKMPNAVFISKPNLTPTLPVFEDRSSRQLEARAPSESKILPMYQVRGFYGPTPEWEDQEFDLVPPPEPSGPTAAALLPTAFSAPMTSIPSPNYSVKRIKIVKVKEPHKKKIVVRKRKPKRVIIQNMAKEEASNPLPRYHEQFYADIDDVGTIKKIKKPKRIERIVNGDTEHIHTYSEEHIHKLIFDDPPKIAGIAGIDPTDSMAALTEANQLFPLKNSQSHLSLSSTNVNSFPNTLSASGATGSLGTPSNMEYIGYVPQEVTHDHVFHDHGEISSTVDITKDSLSRRPKVTYDSRGFIISDPEIIAKSRQRNKWLSQNDILQPITSTPEPDFSYYENMYATTIRPKKIRRPKKVPTKFNDDNSSELDYNTNNFQPVPYMRFKELPKTKNHNSLPYHNEQSRPLNEYTEGKTSDSILSRPLQHLKRPLKSQKDIYTDTRPIVPTLFPKHEDLDSSFLSLKNAQKHTSLTDPYDNDEVLPWPIQSKGKKKSVSTQNISFGGQDHKTVIDHMTNTYETEENVKPTTLREYSNSLVSNKWLDIATPSSSLYTIKENSPLHEYYSAMALKAFQNDHSAAASNNNLQIVDAPSTPPADALVSIATTMIPDPTYDIEPSAETATATSPTNRQSRKRIRTKKLRSRLSHNFKQSQNENVPRELNTGQLFVSQEINSENAVHPKSRHISISLSDNVRNDNNMKTLPARSKFKYGDKL